MKRYKRYIVDYYFNEYKHWAEVYDGWNEFISNFKKVSDKYKFFKVEVFILNDDI